MKTIRRRVLRAVSARVLRPVSMDFFKSSYSGGGNCVEVAMNDFDEVAVRDSKNPFEHSLRFTRTEWQAFLSGVKDGEFDLR
jgi:hypothetical protein